MTIRTWITFFSLSILLGLANVYSTLLTGWGSGGSIVAVILCLIFLTKKEGTIFNYNLGQTMASAGGSVGFTVAIIAAIYYNDETWDPNLFDLSLFVLALSLIGVTIAIPIRNTIVHWFFPTAVACATILRTVTSENTQEKVRAKKIMGFFGGASALLTIPSKAAFTRGGSVLWNSIPLPWGLSLTLDPLLYGIGVVVGLRIGLSMLLGATFNHLVEIPGRWVAVGLMTLPALTSMLFAYYFKNHPEMPAGFTPKSRILKLKSWEIGIIAAIFIFALILGCYSMHSLFAISWEYVISATLISIPLCFALGKVASETDINPVRLLAITLLFIFSILGLKNPISLLAVGIAGSAMAAIAVDLFYDLRTGYLIDANPQKQVVMQFLGVIPISFVAVYFLHMLAQNFGFGPGQYFPAPGAIIWSTMADAFSGEAQDIPWDFLLYSTLFGVFLSFLENHPKTKTFTPSAFAIGIALLLPFELSAAIFLGGLTRWAFISASRDKVKTEEEAFQAGAAIFAASALAGIVVVVLISAGVLFLPS